METEDWLQLFILYNVSKHTLRTDFANTRRTHAASEVFCLRWGCWQILLLSRDAVPRTTNPLGREVNRLALNLTHTTIVLNCTPNTFSFPTTTYFAPTSLFTSAAEGLYSRRGSILSFCICSTGRIVNILLRRLILIYLSWPCKCFCVILLYKCPMPVKLKALVLQLCIKCIQFPAKVYFPFPYIQREISDICGASLSQLGSKWHHCVSLKISVIVGIKQTSLWRWKLSYNNEILHGMSELRSRMNVSNIGLPCIQFAPSVKKPNEIKPLTCSLQWHRPLISI